MTRSRHRPDRNPAAQQSPAVLRCAILRPSTGGSGSETARVHHAARRRGGRVAAGGARAACARRAKGNPHWLGHRSAGFELGALHRGHALRPRRTRLRRGPQPCNRVSLRRRRARAGIGLGSRTGPVTGRSDCGAGRRRVRGPRSQPAGSSRVQHERRPGRQPGSPTAWHVRAAT